jgi:acyl-CoA hydrolase
MALLYDEGVITNKDKNLWKNKIVGALVLGSQELYDFINDNPIVELKRGSSINSPYVIAQNDNQCSVNTALSVDLTGAVSSESFGHLQFSATGGQFETAYGAQLSKGGKSIVALHATAKKGTVSTIVCGFPEGTATTLGRNDVDYVVTEFGIASLCGRSVRERVKALIAIAHPDFRQELTENAEKLGIW